MAQNLICSRICTTNSTGILICSKHASSNYSNKLKYSFYCSNTPLPLTNPKQLDPRTPISNRIIQILGESEQEKKKSFE